MRAQFDVFLSYPRAEEALVRPIANHLRTKGLSVFFDVENIEPGEAFPEAINVAVKSASAVLACWCSEAFQSEWCQREWSVGSHRNVLVPIAIRQFKRIEVPVEFFNLQWIDVHTSPTAVQSDNWERVELRLQGLIARPIGLQTRAASDSQATSFRVPVSADGSMFLPGLRKRTGFRIGRKGNEVLVREFDDALRLLKLMDVPYWRRPSKTSGIGGIVKAVRWEIVRL